VNPKCSEQPDAIQLVTDGELETLTLALLEGAGGWMEAEELDAAMETAFEWAEKVRFESVALKAILCGKLSVRCNPDGEIEFKSKKEELAEPPGESGRSARGSNGEPASPRDRTVSLRAPSLRSSDGGNCRSGRSL
jgi:hypothetical protein